MFYFTDLDKQQIFLFFLIYFGQYFHLPVFSPSLKLHAIPIFFSGIICGPLWGSFVVLGSFAVQFGDHLRSRDHLRRCTHPSHKLTNNVLGYVLTEQFPNGSGADQICSRRTVSFMSICSHGTDTEMVRYQSTSGPTRENQLFLPISYPPADQNT